VNEKAEMLHLIEKFFVAEKIEDILLFEKTMSIFCCWEKMRRFCCWKKLRSNLVSLKISSPKQKANKKDKPNVIHAQKPN
jgi:hypothetical protein